MKRFSNKTMVTIIAITICGALAILLNVEDRHSSAQNKIDFEFFTNVVVAEDSLNILDDFLGKDTQHPPFLVFMGEDTDSDAMSVAQTLWEFAKQPNPLPSGTVSISPPAVYKGKFAIRTIFRGNSPKDVARNLDALVRQCASSSWEMRDGGYLIRLGLIGASPSFLAPEANFPRFTLLAVSLKQSCDFLTRLTGKEIEIIASNSIDPVCQKGGIPGEYVRARQPIFLQTDKSLGVDEILRELARFHGIAAKFEAGKIKFVDPDENEVRARVTQYLDCYKNKNYSRREADRYSLPIGAEAELIRFLQTGKVENVNDIFWTIYCRNIEFDTSMIEDWLLGKSLPKNLIITKEDRTLIAKILCQMGNECAIPYLLNSARSKREVREISLLASRLGSEAGYQLQRRLLLKESKMIIKNPNIEAIPMGVNANEIVQIEESAIGYATTVGEVNWGIGAHGRLTFAKDGKTALYNLMTTTNYKGPLAANGDWIDIYFKKVSKYWFVVGCSGKQVWMS